MRFLAAAFLLLLALPAHAQNMQRALVVSSCGGQTLAAGPLTNLTMNPQGQLCLAGIGGGTSPPSNSVAPVASGSLTIGSLLTTTNGTWSGSPTFTYQWQRNGGTIAGATAQTYTTVNADGGTSVGAQVTATNAGGSASALSNTLAISLGSISTPIFATVTTAPSTTATQYTPWGGSASWNATVLNRGIPSPIAGTISGFQVTSNTAVTTGFYTYSHYVNGVITAQQCSIGTGGANLGSTTACADNGHPITVNQGDLLSIESFPSGTPTAIGGGSPRISALFTSTNPQEVPIFLGLDFPSATAINFVGPQAPLTPVTNEYVASWIMPTAGKIDDLFIEMGVAAGASRLWQFNAFKNGVATGLIAGDATHCGGTSSLTCSDTNAAHAITVAALDTVSIQICPSNVATCPAGSVPTLTNQNISLRFVPTVANQAVIFGQSIAVPANNTGNNFGPFAGDLSMSTTEAVTYNTAPVLASTMTISNMTTAQCPSPDSAGAGVTVRTTTYRLNSVSQAMASVLPSNAITSCPTLTTAQDTNPAHNFTATTAQPLGWLSHLNNTTNGVTPLAFKTSAVVTVP